jgi:hypothetical protein
VRKQTVQQAKIAACRDCKERFALGLIRFCKDVICERVSDVSYVRIPPNPGSIRSSCS